jgi:hypothetical protein
MPTPFDNTAPAAPAPVTEPLATAPQLMFIAKLISEQDWQTDAPHAYVRRVATISATVYLAELVGNDPERAGLASVSITDAADLARTFAEMMAHAHGTAEDARRLADTKPLTRTGASALITWLQGRPVKVIDPAPEHLARVATPGPGIDVDASKAEMAKISRIGQPEREQFPSAEVVPAGRYAIDTRLGAINEVAFYRVDRPTEGRWAGRVFVKHLVGGDEQRLSWRDTRAILTRIAEAGAEAASARYGHEIGRCGICHTRLTNDESRARGIGPKCAAKAGW